jgi:hypothetical protein
MALASKSSLVAAGELTLPNHFYVSHVKFNSVLNRASLKIKGAQLNGNLFCKFNTFSFSSPSPPVGEILCHRAKESSLGRNLLHIPSQTLFSFL